MVERRKAAPVEGGEGGGSVLNSFTTKVTKVHEGNHQGLIPVELFDELLAESESITTEGTGEHGGNTGETGGSAVLLLGRGSGADRNVRATRANITSSETTGSAC